MTTDQLNALIAQIRANISKLTREQHAIERSLKDIL